MRLPRLGDAAGDTVLHQFLVPLAAGGAVVDLRDDMPVGVIAVGIDTGEGAHATGLGPATAGRTIGGGNTLSTLDEREDVYAPHAYCVDRLHGTLS